MHHSISYKPFFLHKWLVNRVCPEKYWSNVKKSCDTALSKWLNDNVFWTALSAQHDSALSLKAVAILWNYLFILFQIIYIIVNFCNLSFPFMVVPCLDSTLSMTAIGQIYQNVHLIELFKKSCDTVPLSNLLAFSGFSYYTWSDRLTCDPSPSLSLSFWSIQTIIGRSIL